MSRDIIIETRNLTKVYRDFWGRPKVQALKALDLQVYRGEIFGLLGPNGSGKTTTIKLLLGLLFATEGDALIFGESTTNVAKNERIGYLPEESYLYKFLNASGITVIAIDAAIEREAKKRRALASEDLTIKKV